MTATAKPTTLFVQKANGLVTALQVATVVACLALGVAFVGTLWNVPAAPPATTAQTCPAGPGTC
jgi:hypothetical protein